VTGAAEFTVEKPAATLARSPGAIVAQIIGQELASPGLNKAHPTDCGDDGGIAGRAG
jgi:hypothetical protein